MSWEAIGAIAELMGAGAVFASLIYLAIQTKQNTRALRSAAFHQVRDSFSDVSLTMAQDERLGSVFRRAASDEPLSDTEYSIFNYLLTTLVRRGESAFFQSSDGTLQNDSWHAVRKTLVVALSSEAGRKWLEGVRGRFTHEYLEDLLDAVNVGGSISNDPTFHRGANDDV